MYLWLRVPAGCGGELSGSTGSFNSPGYPSRYPENRECIWYITTSAGSSITLTVQEFDVEFHPDCNYDVLEVRYERGCYVTVQSSEKTGMALGF